MGNLGGKNEGPTDPKWTVLQPRRDYFLNKLDIYPTTNYSIVHTSNYNYYVGSVLDSNNKPVNYYNYYYNLNPIWKKMGLKSY